jgi:hypothetical protein
MSVRAIMDMINALHATVDRTVRFSTPMYDAIIPAVHRPMNAAAFIITSYIELSP